MRRQLAPLALVACALLLSCDAIFGPRQLALTLTGGRQSAMTGETLQEPITATVSTSGPDPRGIKGKTIRWEVEGGGSLDASMTTTDADGRTSVRWTIGDGPIQKVRAFLDEADAMAQVYAGHRTRDLAINIQEPGTALVAGRFQVRAKLEHVVYSIAGVNATLGDVTTAFPESSLGGEVDSAGIPWGPADLRVEVRDAHGNVADMAMEVVIDAPPKLEVKSPVAFSVARPDVAIDATCVDDGPEGCVRLEVLVDGELIARGKGSVQLTHSLAAYADSAKPPVIAFAGYDSAGQQTVVNRPVHVNTNPALELVEAFELPVADFSSEFALLWDSRPQPGWENFGLVLHTLFLRNRATGVTTELTRDGRPEKSRVVPGGAAFISSSKFHLLLGDKLAVFDSGFAADESGRYLAYYGATGLVQRDVLATNDVATSMQSGYPVVSGNGDVLVIDVDGEAGYSRYYHTTHRCRDGSCVEVLPRLYGWYEEIVPDGADFYYQTDDWSNGGKLTKRAADGTETIIDSGIEVDDYVADHPRILHTKLAVSDGQVYYLKNGRVVWYWNGASPPVAVASLFRTPDLVIDRANGAFVYRDRQQWTYHLQTATGKRHDLGTKRPVVRDGQLFAIIGTSIFRVQE